jgi:hypothetical protein
MKTPREILLRRHRTAEPKLDRIREEVLAAELSCSAPSTRERKSQNENLIRAMALKLWHELVWPCRCAWTGMGVLWLMMLAINLGLSGHRPADLESSSAPASDTGQVLQEQRRLLAELIPPAPSQPSEPPRRNHLQPRSARRIADKAC